MVGFMYARVMPRQTTTEIDAEIIDRAAALFARHGFERTSLQQVADAVGYTKAGLLHHFPSKQAIYDAVLLAVKDQAAGLVSSVEGLSPGAERDQVVIATLVTLTERWPGISEFTATLVSDTHAPRPELEQAGLAILLAFAVDLEYPNEERLIRIAGAAVALNATVLQAVRDDLTPDRRGAIIEMTMNTLGHPGSFPH
ncbi:TetR/AcrR family transcriptional regulator [Microbacterium sp. SA39]|uniref:TetR/AcrR family transcriptional regulator n=1 Tax=Microbacterium sp. SA39 TaxID=1263625 RepID=UPI00061F9FC5|nr:TetR/AcrR family transcriptional regulator [Microbacterium sp. SA39]KJQ52495.1 HTH-type transcriptional repressor KstR2 [Microbacterium sp. SA39]